MKKTLLFSLIITLIFSLLCTFSSCSKRTEWSPNELPEWEPYELTEEKQIELIYHTEGYTPTTQYLLTLEHLKPEDELITFFDIYLTYPYYYEYVIINPDLSMMHTEQELSNKEKESFIKMTRMPPDSDTGTRNNWNWNRHLNLAHIEKLQASKDADSTWIISQYVALDTGYLVIFCQKENTDAPDFLAEVGLDGKILRIIRFDGFDGITLNLKMDMISVRIDD